MIEEMTVTIGTHEAEAVGLTPGEYREIVHRLGRIPTRLELQLFGVMWSEHCSYKHSADALQVLPTQGSHVLQGPGENAGVLDIGDGWAIALKMESHNHPSAVDPFNGAATGVGGIIRDILAMGARPIALIDSLRVGPLQDPKSHRLLSTIVGGIAAYGNCIGVPTVAGEVKVDASYRDNPLVNVACLGLVRHEAIARARAHGVGNPVLYVGARTGRDGIGGAAFASAELDEHSEREDRSSVQMGDPFAGKLLIEATLTALGTGAVVAIQDMGAAGLICAAAEMAARGGVGIAINLDAVPLRETQMASDEILRSESQERMLLVVHRGQANRLIETFLQWGLAAAVIGEVIAEPLVQATYHGAIVATVPAAALTEAPRLHPPARPPVLSGQHIVPELSPPDVVPEAALATLLMHPDVASKRAIFSQYDHTVQVRTVVPPGVADAAVLRLQEAPPKGIALTVEGSGRVCALDPYRGAQLAVAEAAAGLACVGAESLGVVDCLNFGNPDAPEVFWTFQQAVAGIADACRALGLPVVGGNVSFYNESPAAPIVPTPIVAMAGLLEDVSHTAVAAFRETGDIVFLLGGPVTDLAGSLYARIAAGDPQALPPAVDFAMHRRLLTLVRTAIARRWVRSAHDCSDGGLAVAVAECVLTQGVGAELLTPLDPTPAVALFGEAPSRIVVAVVPDTREAFEELAHQLSVPATMLGVTGGAHLRIAAPQNPERYVIDLVSDRLATLYDTLTEVLR